MSQVNVFDLKGKEVSKLKLKESVFKIEKNDKLIHQVVNCQLANARQANAHTKTRGQVAGGGAKPWKQKGTGRARAGSSNSPIWKGGGIVFGPTNSRNFSQMINKKMKRKALLMALSDKAENKKLIITEDFNIKEPKTKILIEILDNLPTSDGSTLIVLPESNLNLELSSANIPYVKLVRTSGLNILDILRFDYLLTTKDGLKVIETLFSDDEEVIKDVKLDKNIEAKEIEEAEKAEIEVKKVVKKKTEKTDKKPSKKLPTPSSKLPTKAKAKE